MSAQRLVAVTLLASPLLLACSDDGARGDVPMFTSGDASQGGDGDGDETGDTGMGDGDGAPAGDGDGAPTGDGDGAPGDGDGAPGDGDGTPGDGDGDPNDPCTTPPNTVGTSCGQDVAFMGAIAMGETMDTLPTGGITATDNGPGNGAEDWYRFDFPLDANNPRPAAGTITLDFAVNQGGDYRFELYRDCGAQAYGQGLASEFGSNAPPLLEWTFNDLTDGLEQANYLENVLWPSTVWVRVVRFQNDGECSNYQLQVTRQ